MFKVKLVKIIVTFAFILSSIFLQSSEMGETFDKRLFSDDIRIVQEAITEGADINAKDDYGHTALIVAIHFNRLEIAKLLIDSGADLNIKYKYDNTALITATYNSALVSLLIGSKADVNAKNEDGSTALILAALFNSIKTAELLIEADTDLDIQNNKLGTALSIAESHNRTDIVKLIKDRIEKRKKEAQNYLSDPDTQILPSTISNIIREYL